MRLLKESKGNDRETRTYSITALSYHLDKLEVLLRFFEVLGNIGHSSSVHIWYDGDGNARIEVLRLGKDNKKTKLEDTKGMEGRLSEYMDDNHNIPDGIGFD